MAGHLRGGDDGERLCHSMARGGWVGGGGGVCMLRFKGCCILVYFPLIGYWIIASRSKEERCDHEIDPCMTQGANLNVHVLFSAWDQG